MVEAELEHYRVGVVVPGDGLVAGRPHRLTLHRAREVNLGCDRVRIMVRVRVRIPQRQTRRAV